MNKNRSRENRALRAYAAFQLFFNLLLWVPIFYEFQKRIGLSDPEIFGIQSIYYLAFCFLEIPTGWIADRFGYRYSMIAGAMALVVANVLPGLAANYSGLLFHFILIALARSLISGASSAWLYEYLSAQGRKDQYKQIEGEARFYALVGRVACWAVVGYIMSYQLYLPYWLSALNAAIAVACAFALPTVLPKDRALATTPERATTNTTESSLRLAWKSLTSSPLILLFMLQGIGIFVMVRILQVNLYQPVLGSKEFDVASFGWIMSLMTLFEAVGSKSNALLRQRIDDAKLVLLANLVLGFCLIGIALGGKISVLVGFCIFSLAAGLVFPVQKQLLNDAINDGRTRALLLSVESILDRAVCAVAVLPLGTLVKKGLVGETLIVFALCTAVGTGFIHHLAIRLKGKRMKTQKFAAALILAFAVFPSFARATPLKSDPTTNDWVFFDLGDVLVTGDPTQGYTLVPGVINYLKSLRTHAYKTAVITNIPESFGASCLDKVRTLQTFVADNLRGPEPFDWTLFDMVVVPPFDRYQKPHPYMFLRALERACSSRALFVGEDATELAAAADLGIAAFAVTDDSQAFPRLDQIKQLLDRDFHFQHPNFCRFDELIDPVIWPQDRSSGVSACALSTQTKSPKGSSPL